ncbi:hypothetical protein LCGC14_1875800 [marine sediment metagenome]|uniref:Uncharacterized protein n=1 Tax=marine sediment metagenome TaxID=412755 RepID=A0A0F9G3W4_9ZZZZ
MGLFAKKIAPESVEYRLGALAAEVQSLKSGHKHLELEWEELYDKVRHQMARMSRRVKADAKLNGDEQPLDPAVEPDDGVDPISRSILARRGTRRPTQ